MYVPYKKLIAILLIIALSATYFMACGVKDADKGESGDASEESFASSENSPSTENSEKSEAGSVADNSSGASKEESYAQNSSEVSRPIQNSSAPDISDVNSSQKPDNSEEMSMENSKPSNVTEISEITKDEISVKPEDSSIAPPVDSSVAPPYEDSSIAPPADSSVAPPEDSSVAPPVESSVAPPADSSEESSYVPTDPSDPLTPIPEALYADAIDSHFNNSVFLGYSIMMHFGRYVGQWRMQIDSTIMGNSINVGAVGISFWSNSQQSPSMSNNSLPRYRGVAYNFEDLPAATGCNTMYIGLTCYSEMKVYSDPQSAADEVISGVGKIKEKNPGVTIVLLSGTYNTGTFEQLGSKYSKRLSNENIRKFNNYVLDYCNQNGVDFVDVSTPLTNGYGFLPIEYSSDNDYHIAKDAFLIWIDVLRDYARKKEAGTWQNLSVMPELGM